MTAGLTSRVTYRYDRQGRLQSIGNSDAEAIAAYTYAADGTVRSERLGTTVERALSRDSLGRPTRIGAPGFVQELDYRHSARPHAPFGDGRMCAETVNRFDPGTGSVVRRDYTYSGFGRLTAATSDRNEDILRARYDAHANLAELRERAAKTGFSYAPGSDRLASTTGSLASAFSYTPTGDLRDDVTHHFAYDATSKQTRRIVGRNGGGTTRIRYVRTFDGRLVLRKHGSGSELRVFGLGLRPIAAIGPAVSQAFVYGAGGLVAYREDGQDHYVVRDVRGSTRAVHDADGTILSRFDYDVFGAVSAGSSPPSLSWLYTGHEFETELGIYNFGARHYDPAVGRFAQTDPARQTASPYSYADGDPVNFVDPDGRVVFVVYDYANYLFFVDMRGEILTAISQHQSINAMFNEYVNALDDDERLLLPAMVKGQVGGVSVYVLDNQHFISSAWEDAVQKLRRAPSTDRNRFVLANYPEHQKEARRFATWLDDLRNSGKTRWNPLARVDEWHRSPHYDRVYRELDPFVRGETHVANTMLRQLGRTPPRLAVQAPSASSLTDALVAWSRLLHDIQLKDQQGLAPGMARTLTTLETAEIFPRIRNMAGGGRVDVGDMLADLFVVPPNRSVKTPLPNAVQPGGYDLSAQILHAPVIPPADRYFRLSI